MSSILPRSLKLITFDVTNTVLRFRKNPHLYYAEFASLNGIKVDYDKIDESFREVFKKYNISSPNFGLNHEGWYKWWQKVIHDTITLSGGSLDIIKNQHFYHDLINIFATGETYEIIPGFLPLINELNKKDIIIGTISNTDDRLETILKNINIKQYFNFVLTSYKAKVMKPHPNIFQLALNFAGSDISPSQAIHIGDNIRLDYIAAKEAGWNSILVSKDFEKNCIKNGICVDKNYMFNSLWELIPIFNDL